MNRASLAALLFAFAADAQPCTPCVIAVGDSRTADRGDGQTPWPSQVTEIYVANYAVGGRVFSQCQTDWLSAWAAETLWHSRTAVQCGVNDIINLGANGHTLFTTEKTWAESIAGPANTVFFFNIPGFKNYDSTASKLTARNDFNSDFATYCVSPATYVKCVDIATPMQSGGDADALAAAYDVGDGIHFSTAGHAVVKTAFEAVFP